MQITGHIHALKIPFRITVKQGITVDRFVYVYLVCGKKLWLIDTGVAGSDKIIFDYLKSIGRTPSEISAIFLTHSHPDHIGSAKSIKKVSGCPAYIHAAEKLWAEDVETQYEQRPVPGFHSLVEGSVAIGRTLKDRDSIELDGDLILEVFHTPGHSKGSVSFLLKKDRALFCGDAILLPGQMPVFEDFLSSLDSLNALRKIGGVDVILSSWDQPQQGGQIDTLLDESLKYMMEIRDAVRAVAATGGSSDIMELCRQVIRSLKLPDAMANPLVARSFQSILNSPPVF